MAEVRRWEVRLEVAWSHQDASPYVSEYAVSLDDQLFGVIRKEPGRPGCTLRVNLGHPSLLSIAQVESHSWSGVKLRMTDQIIEKLVELGANKEGKKLWSGFTAAQIIEKVKTGEITPDEAVAMIEKSFEPPDGLSGLAFLFLEAAAAETISSLRIEAIPPEEQGMPWAATVDFEGQTDALPCWGRMLTFRTDLEGKGVEEGIDIEAKLEWIIESVSELLVGPGHLVRDALAGFRYLGPLRETPLAGTFRRDSRLIAVGFRFGRGID